MSDVQVNCSSAVRITHYFVNKFMKDKDISEEQDINNTKNIEGEYKRGCDRGALFFISSPAGNPFMHSH